MSVPKSKRKQSKVEFEMLIFKVCESVDRLVETRFSTDPDELAANQIFISSRSANLEHLTDSLIYHIKVANSIYPKCMAEWEERRVSIGKAVGTCYAILTNLQRVMIRLRVPDNRYTEDIKNVVKMINSLKAWRKSDNRLKATLTE